MPRTSPRAIISRTCLPNSPLGKHVREMIARGDVRGMSYGILSLPTDSEVSKRNGVWHRTIRNARRMLDVSLTWEPAYEATSVELRSMGFSALSLQEILVGEEAQPEEAAVEGTSRVVKPLFGRMAGIVIDELEK